MKLKVLICMIFILANKNLLSQEIITINAASDSGSFKNFTGFLHGEKNLNEKPLAIELVKKLKPKFWRNSDWYQTQKLATSLSINTSLVISDFYANFKGGYSNAKPWLNWLEYETFITALVKNYNTAGLAPNYWDIWNEPDDISYWSGTLLQLVECFKRTALIIHKIDSSIKIVGPSINSYNGPAIEFILDELANSGVKFNGVSWHEFGIPDSLPNHTNDFKNRILVNPLWGKPEIHVNEYSPQQTNQIPAYKLAWLYYLEQNNVNWANTACWNNFDGTTRWSNCNVGLNGLLWHDEQSTLAAYWITRAYAEMQNGKRIFCTHSTPKTIALSSKIDDTKEMRILVGRYYSIDDGTFLSGDVGKDSANVIININNYPYFNNENVSMVIQKITKGNLIFQNSPFKAPINIYSGITKVTDKVITIALQNFKDGDVYYVYLNTTNILKDSEPVLHNNFTVYPNPIAANFITIESKEVINDNLVVLDMLGRSVLTKKLNGKQFVIDINQLPRGVYFIKFGGATNKIVKN
jgi:Secretion system C-terminal sorting domain